MYDIYATDLEFEQCAKDKLRINMLMPYAVIHFVLSGEGYINGKKIEKNTMFIASKETHMNYYPSRSNPWSYIYLRLTGSEVEKAFAHYGFLSGITIRPFYEQEPLFQLLNLYKKLNQFESQKTQKIIANAVFLLFEERIKHPENSKSRQRMLQIKRYIDDNYYKPITMEKIAARFFLNKNYMRTLFVQNIGVSPKQYLQNIRMERAKYLILSSNESINIIANSVGYADSLLFSKTFKQCCGCSPKEYRKNISNCNAKHLT